MEFMRSSIWGLGYGVSELGARIQGLQGSGWMFWGSKE